MKIDEGWILYWELLNIYCQTENHGGLEEVRMSPHTNADVWSNYISKVGPAEMCGHRGELNMAVFNWCPRFCQKSNLAHSCSLLCGLSLIAWSWRFRCKKRSVKPILKGEIQLPRRRKYTMATKKRRAKLGPQHFFIVPLNIFPLFLSAIHNILKKKCYSWGFICYCNSLGL